MKRFLATLRFWLLPSPVPPLPTDWLILDDGQSIDWTPQPFTPEQEARVQEIVSAALASASDCILSALAQRAQRDITRLSRVRSL